MSPDKFSQTKLYKLLMPKPHIGLRISARLAPHKANAKYLLKHKWHVLCAGLKLNVPLWRLIIHDWSKLTPIEWFAYTRYFFGKRASDHNMHVPGQSQSICSHVNKEEVPGSCVADEPGHWRCLDCEARWREDEEVIAYLETEDAKLCPPPPGAPNTADMINEADRVAQQFDRAWLHHIHCNPHHWQHWVLSQDDGEVKCLEMPTHFAREMVADWIGAGIAQGKTDKTSVLVWYEKNKESIKLHNQTRELVESLIKVYVYS